MTYYRHLRALCVVTRTGFESNIAYMYHISTYLKIAYLRCLRAYL